MKFMKNRAVLSAALLLATSIASATALLPGRVYKAAQERVDAGEYPVLVIGYIEGDKSEIDALGKLDTGKTPDANTVFEIGSITKTFTATLLAEAVQSGALKLDMPVAELLPDFKIPSRNGRQITLLDIATQHSGLPRMPTNFKPADPANPYADYGAERLKSFLAAYTLTRDPGESYEYSNLGFGLLGFALARRAHKSYGALLDEKIFRPLNMKMSGTTFTDVMRAHLAPGHDEMGKPTKTWDFDALAGAGAIRSNTSDMLRYLTANMGVRKTALDAAMKFAQQPRQDIGKDLRIGLAWMTRVNPHGNILWHNGGTGGYRSFLGFSADGRRGVVVLTNTDDSVDDIGLATLADDVTLAPAHKAVTLPAASLDDYVGEYQLAEHVLINISRNGDQLFTQATGQGGFPIFPSAPDEFFAKVAGISISFKRNPQGQISGLVLHQNGDHTAPKASTADVAAATKSTQLDVAVLRDYVGSYQLAPGAVFDITLKNAQLFAQLSGQPSVPVYASARDKFFYTVVDAKLDFERDANGKVVALVLHQNGPSPRASRIKP